MNLLLLNWNNKLTILDVIKDPLNIKKEHLGHKYVQIRKSLFLKLIIEYDGEGHYEPIDFAGKGKEWANKNFERIKKYDNLKNDYCKENNLFLLRIPYWEFNNIKEIIYQEIEKLKTFNDYPVKE